MYENFYKLKRRPFSTTPDPTDIYWAEPHTMALTILRYGLMTCAPITVVTGEIGAGKTTLLRHLLREAPQDVSVGLISNYQPGRGSLLDWILMSLDLPLSKEGYVADFARFQKHLIARYAEGARVALIFDEAHNMSSETLEELRMFSNINADENNLLQLILVGQPQLRDTLRRPELVQFVQRITADYHLGALGADEVEEYIAHRLSSAGASWRIFSTEACALVAEATGGVPRLINILCDLSLVYGYAAESPVIDEDCVREFLDSARARGVYQQFSPVAARPGTVSELVRKVP